MTSDEPSFEGFFSTQQRPSTHSSFDLPSKSYNPAGSSSSSGPLFGAHQSEAPIMYADEPQSLDMRDHKTDHIHPHHELRKDSVPFDPASSSTLIASVANGAPSQPHHQYHDPSFSYQFQAQHHPSDIAFLQQQAAAMGAGDQQMYDSGLGSTPHSGDWSNSMLHQQEEADPQGHSRRTSFNGGLAAFDDHEQQFEELQRIISNASSHGQVTPAELSRAASPFVSQDAGSPFIPQDQAGSPFIPQDQPSASSSAFPESARSPSPFVTAPSPPIRSSSGSSPSFSKPQSPPALVIPNSAPSPQYQPLVAAPQQPTQSTTQFGNSLLPPANPALTGMAGISPIADNADGPMITIQPSTPISGLKESRGVFDAALRHATQVKAAQTGTGAQGQSNGVQPAAMTTTESGGPGIPSHHEAFVRDAQHFIHNLGDMSGLSGTPAQRARAKSESYGTGGEAFDRQAMLQAMNNPALASHLQQQHQQAQPAGTHSQDQWINSWRMSNAAAEAGDFATMDPRQLPGQSQMVQPGQVHGGLTHINTGVSEGAAFKYEPGQISPTSMAVYQQLGLQAQAQAQASGSLGGSANSSPGYMYQPGMVEPAIQSHFLIPETNSPSVRRRSFAEGTVPHHAVGAGTPGYGIEFTMPGALTPPGRARPFYHRRAARSEDFGRFGAGASGSGWGVGQGGSTADFLNAITNPNDGTLLPPTHRGRSYSHGSSVSSVRSASPALSVSSQGSSYSHHSHMDMPDHMMDMFGGDPRGSKVAKLKVTSLATEVASQSRRTNSGIFHCPVPECGSTFTRHFNLKGHLRSHNDERPYKCLYEGCPKATVGFARQHDCKRHMLLHEGLRPFECEGCGKKFARLDALTRHHKSEQGQECAISHPLPTNPDGSAMSESQYKAYRLQQMAEKGKGIKLDPALAGPSGGA